VNQDSIFNLNNIPEVWGIATLSEIAKNERNAIKRGPFGSAIKKSFFVPTGYKVYEQKNVIYNDFKRGSYYISDEKFYELESFKVKAGDILMSCSGTVGKLSIVPSDFEEGIINQALLKITLNNNIIYTRFFFYLFGFNISWILQKNTRGSAMLNISSVRDLKNIQFPMPPLPEQQRIVAKLEELFTRLDAGVQALKQAQLQLKRYRQSVLKAAVEGRITAEWREKHKDELEPAEKLLERILKERREKWEAEQLARYEAQVKKPPKNWQDKYKEPNPPDTTNLPELPIMWSWVTIGQISMLISGQHIITKNYNQKCNGLPYLTGPTDFGTKFPITSKWTEFPKAISIKDDVLITVKGAGVGKTNILNLDESAISRQLMAIRSQHIRPDFIFYYLKLKFDYFQQIGQGSTVPGIDRENILNTPIPYPPFSEQSQITIEIDKTLSIIEESESIIKSELKRAQSLRQSILKRAFDGKLVPQDPNDLPASVLLERIKAEKSNNKKPKQMEIK